MKDELIVGKPGSVIAMEKAYKNEQADYGSNDTYSGDMISLMD